MDESTVPVAPQPPRALVAWESAVHELQRKAPAAFERWFGLVQFDGLTDGVLQLRAQTPFVRDFVTAHYLPLLTERIRESTQWNVEVTWVVDAQLFSPIATRKTEPAPPPEPAARPHASLTAVPTPVPHNQPIGLNPKYVFANFVVGPSNELAHAAALAASGSGSVRRYNPLFICGGTGLGKTHLLHAIGHMLLSIRPHVRVVIVSAEAFTNEFIAALADKQMDAFRNRYRTQCDLLLMDDVHDLAGREQTQEEFFHTFNALHTTDRRNRAHKRRYPPNLSARPSA